MKFKTALVFGCNGQDGSLICHSLLKKGYKVIGLSRSQISEVKNHIELGIEKEVERRNGDIRNFETISRLIENYQPEEIYNLAGQSSVGTSFIDPTETISGIINGTINILEVCRKLSYRGKIFFAGSSEIFGNTEHEADIDHTQKPNSPYAIAKQSSFNLVKMYREVYNLNCVTGVLFNHESHLREDSFVTQKIIKAARKISKDKSIKIKLGNIEIIRDWGWAPEYIEAMQIIANSEILKDYVICSGSHHSLRNFTTKVFAHYKLNWEDHIEIDKSLFRPREIKQSFGNPERLFNELGWKASVNIDSIISKMIMKSIY